MSLLHDYSYVLGFLIIGIGFVVLNYFLPLMLSPKSRGAMAKKPYESGEVPIGSAWIQFDISYYLFALIFIAFDVEVAFLFPVLTAYQDVISLQAFAELAFFLVLLSFAIFYAWRKGLFEWK